MVLVSVVSSSGWVYGSGPPVNKAVFGQMRTKPNLPEICTDSYLSFRKRVVLGSE